MPEIIGWNRHLVRLAALTLLAGLASPASATKVYQYTNSAGETVFTDEPVAGAKVHEVESAPVIPMKRVAPPAADPAPEATAAEAANDPPADTSPAPATKPPASPAGKPVDSPPADYAQLAIVEPVDGEVASRLHGSITIQLAIKPALRAADRVFILVDGEPRVRDSGGRRHLVNGLSPGAHELVAQIRRDGQVLRESAPVQFKLVTPAQ